MFAVITINWLSAATSQAPSIIISEIATIQGNTIVGYSTPSNFKPIIYGELIDCMIDAEGWNGKPEHRGDNGLAIGLLQFHYETFKQFCVNEYSLPDDIFDDTIQIQCADRMIQNELYFHWGRRTRNMCPL